MYRPKAAEAHPLILLPSPTACDPFPPLAIFPLPKEILPSASIWFPTPIAILLVPDALEFTPIARLLEPVALEFTPIARLLVPFAPSLL